MTSEFGVRSHESIYLYSILHYTCMQIGTNHTYIICLFIIQLWHWYFNGSYKHDRITNIFLDGHFGHLKSFPESSKLNLHNYPQKVIEKLKYKIKMNEKLYLIHRQKNIILNF